MQYIDGVHIANLYPSGRLRHASSEASTFPYIDIRTRPFCLVFLWSVNEPSLVKGIVPTTDRRHYCNVEQYFTGLSRPDNHQPSELATCGDPRPCTVRVDMLVLTLQTTIKDSFTTQVSRPRILQSYDRGRCSSYYRERLHVRVSAIFWIVSNIRVIQSKVYECVVPAKFVAVLTFEI